MSLSSYLKKHSIKEYKDHYLDYKQLKQQYSILKEDQFKQSLTENLTPINKLIKTRTKEFNECVKMLEQELDSCLNIKKQKKSFKAKVFHLKKLLSKLSKFIKHQNNILNKFNCKKLLVEPELDPILYKLSKIVLVCYKKGSKSKQKNIDGKNFSRKTDKYWIHSDNVTTLKTQILKYLPIFLFEADKLEEDKFEAEKQKKEEKYDPYKPIDRSNPKLSQGYNSPHIVDNLITSIYLDNSELYCYMQRIYKLPKSICIRLRYYTHSEPDTVYVERKMHEDSWTGNTSNKKRFLLPADKVNNYIKGEDVYKYAHQLNGDVKVLYTEIQAEILKNKLRPAIRTVYRRTAFQLPNCNKIRLSLDTQLCMIREASNFELSNNVVAKNWKRNDIQPYKYPYRQLKRNEIVRFPHAILEIKTHSLKDQEPFWVTNLRNSGLLEHVHKFSKYMHGMSTLYPFIKTVPYWLPQLEKNINVLRDEVVHSDSFTNLTMGSSNSNLIELPKDKLSHCSHLTNNKITNNKRKSLGIEEITDPKTLDSDNSTIILNMNDKIVAIPCKVEPKVFFANERTFLSWLNFSIFIGGIGTALLGLGQENARIPGACFIMVAIMFSLYALYLFMWRGERIRRRDPGPYDDKIGPIFLVFAFLSSLIVALVFKFPLKVRY